MQEFGEEAKVLDLLAPECKVSRLHILAFQMLFDILVQVELSSQMSFGG